MNFYSAFLTGSNYTANADIVRHMQYIKNAAGIASVALGSDFDGIDCELELRDYSHFDELISAMSCAFTDDEIDLILSGNALRVFKDAVG